MGNSGTQNFHRDLKKESTFFCFKRVMCVSSRAPERDSLSTLVVTLLSPIKSEHFKKKRDKQTYNRSKKDGVPHCKFICRVTDYRSLVTRNFLKCQMMTVDI